MPTELLIALASIGIPATVGWIVRIERAIGINDKAVLAASTKAAAVKELIEARFDAQEKAFQTFDLNIDRRLARIETTLNGFLKEIPHA